MEAKTYYIITFANMTQALAFADVAPQYQLVGRLIPIPSQISAQCGFGFQTEFIDEKTGEAMAKIAPFSKIYQVRL